MSKKKKQQKKIIEKKPVKSNKLSLSTFLFRNFIGFFLLFFLFNYLIAKVPGYNWIWNDLLKNNLEIIEKYGHLNTDQKHELKQGAVMSLFNFINNNTPEDAIILMPSDSVISGISKKYELKYLSDRRKATYFIYPRRLVYKEYANSYDSAFIEKISHVAILGFHGYQNLSYKVQQKQEFAILPINQSEK